MLQDSPYTLNNVRTITNYGFYVIGNTIDPVFSKGVINAKPNISIQGSTCIIDYSHVFDVSDLIYLKHTFGGLTVGNTFGITNSEYFDEYNNINKTIGGTCYFQYTRNAGQIIIGTIYSGLTTYSDYNYYSKENFVDVPQYSFDATGGTIGYFLVNSLPKLTKTSFKKMGIVGSAFSFEEYIDISGGICWNSERIPIYGTTTLKDGQELLYFASGGTHQSFIDTSTTVNLYLRGKPTLLTAPYTSNVTGIFTINDTTNGSLVNCFENQSYNEATLRRYALVSPFAGYFSNCVSCYDLIYGSGLGTPWSGVLPEFNNLVYITVTSPNTVQSIYAQQSNLSTSTTTTNISLTNSINNVLKIDLSHPSLIGYVLELYYDAAYKIPLGTVYNTYGTSGYNGAYGLVTSYLTASTIYCVLSGPTNLYFTLST